MATQDMACDALLGARRDARRNVARPRSYRALEALCGSRSKVRRLTSRLATRSLWLTCASLGLDPRRSSTLPVESMRRRVERSRPSVQGPGSSRLVHGRAARLDPPRASARARVAYGRERAPGMSGHPCRLRPPAMRFDLGPALARVSVRSPARPMSPSRDRATAETRMAEPLGGPWAGH